jgi:hypothetical protein
LWVQRAQADRTHGRTGLTTAEREELARLRKENRELRTERDILKKAAVNSRSTSSKVCLDRGGEGRVHGRRLLSGAPRLSERLLRLAATARVGACDPGSPAAGTDPRLAYGPGRNGRHAARSMRFL